MGNVPELEHVSGSWVIVNKETGEGVCEIFSRAIVEKINFDKYEAKTALVYLSSLNVEGTTCLR